MIGNGTAYVSGCVCDRRHRRCCRRCGNAATQRVGPAQVEGQRLQHPDRPDFLSAMRQEPGHPAVLDDAVGPFGQLAPAVDFVAFRARHSCSPRLDRRRLVAAFPAPLAQRLGGDLGALRRRRTVDRQIGMAFGQFDDVLLGHRRGIGQQPLRHQATALGNGLDQCQVDDLPAQLGAVRTDDPNPFAHRCPPTPTNRIIQHSADNS